MTKGLGNEKKKNLGTIEEGGNKYGNGCGDTSVTEKRTEHAKIYTG